MFIQNKTTKQINNKGYIVMLVLVFSAVFALIASGLTGFIFTQNKLATAKENREKAIQIAEAGLDYYKWFLAHNPGDLTDGTGQPGPYEHAYSDPEGGKIGTFSLEINGNMKCNNITSIDITSTGWVDDDPSMKRVVYGKYAQPSVAEYAHILNSNVWAGSGRNIKGRYHSNGGIRMDGTNESVVTSSVEDWSCTSSFGCNPTETVSGVFGSGENSHLWEFPVEPVDFVGMTLDLINMKTQAQDTGLYFAQVSGGSDQRGYHAIFKEDSTVDVYVVNNSNYVWGYDSSSGWNRDYHIITSETFMGNYDIPTDCSLIFFEDKLWIEGVISEKVTVAVADVTLPNRDPDTILNGNITYYANDGSDGLTIVSENSILIPLRSPNNMEINGILIAQKGYFGRNYYPWWYWPWHIRNSLTIMGTIVSDGRVSTSWGCPGFCSGYISRVNSYDRKLATDPPPMTPFVDDEYRFIEWREEDE